MKQWNQEPEKWKVFLESRRDKCSVLVYARTAEGARKAGLDAARVVGFQGVAHTNIARLATPLELGCVPISSNNKQK